MTWDEIQLQVRAEVGQAEKHVEQISVDRQEYWDRYHGRPLGNEVEGRSRYMSRDLLDKVQWMMPHLLNTFAMGHPKVDLEILGKPPIVAQALMAKIQQDLGDGEPSLFRLFYDWFLDALVSGTAFLKLGWNLDYEKVEQTFPAVTAPQMQQLLNDPQVEVVGMEGEAYTPTGLVFRGVRAKILKQTSDEMYAEGMPPWEALWHPDAREMDDDKPKGHKTRVTVDYLKRIDRAYRQGDEPFFWFLDEVERGASPSSDGGGRGTEYGASAEAEKQSYYNRETWYGDDTETGPRRAVDLVEWYTRLDIDGDGFLENVTAWLADQRLIRVEINRDGFIPITKCSPIRDPYKFEGKSMAELLVDIQNLKTMITRQTLDNLAFNNSGRWLVDPAGNVDVIRLLSSAPGDYVYGKQGSVVPLIPPMIPLQQPLALLEYADTIGENRTGLTRYNQGMDADSLNKTATGVVRIQEAGKVRIHAVAALIAEDGLRQFYRKCAWLYQKHMTKPFVQKVHGQEVQVTPEMIQGKVKARVDLGLAAILEEGEIRRMDRAVQFLIGLAQHWPGLVSPEGAHNLATRYLDTLGFKDPSLLVAPLEEFVQGIQARAQQEQQAQQQALQQQLEMARQQLALKMKELDIKDKDSIRDFIEGLIGEQNPLAILFLSAVNPAGLVTTQTTGNGGTEPRPVPNVLMGHRGQVPPDLVAQVLQ